ncbi:GNAT family N-acetyltransferase [Actinoplanes sp. TBRC 11911]|uniref:GNAT family N-acetyltransferase n=1 Tax=Actinoplanes sp. TBRC 11911 TaxID=2729386 RepID=UPI00145CEC1D|nr:GNAT family N-acetyltransferase [Actinoplanes sp. TBRC 11911]NMO52383.1 GNAT family N-acetyltransferase [Actinoplanes sp. TBRC 11911]
MSDVVLRDMRPGELDAVVELLATASAWDIRHRLRVRLTATEPDALSYVVVAARDGDIVGAGKITNEPAFPGTASVAVAAVLPGVGDRLMDRIVARLTEIRGATRATMALRDDVAEGRRLAERYGFTLANHDIGLRLALPGPESALATSAQAAAAEARVLVRVAEPASEEATIMAAVARGLVGLLVPFGADQSLDPAATRALIPPNAVILLAFTPLAVCGVMVVAPQTGSDEWHIEFTGVDPDFRGRGVATALKTEAHLEAFRAGARAITTVNDEANTAIVRLNRKLGMTPAPGYWGMVRPLQDEASD